MHVAIVGAGMGGAGAAYALRDTDGVDVTVYESGTVGGRAAAARRGGVVYDYGANYLSDADPETLALVRSLDADLVAVEGDVWTFDGAGAVSEGDDRHDEKVTDRRGLDHLPRAALEAAGATVETGATVRSVSRSGAPGGGWRLDVTGRDRPVEAGAVVVTPPGPETASLLEGEGGAARLRDAAAAVPYRTVLSVALHYPFEVEAPYYALVNTDGAHDVGWLARESCKPGHVPPGEELLVAQMAPGWSADHLGDDGAPARAADAVAALLGDERLADPDWTAAHGFERALADGAADAGAVDAAAG
ncbi:MAG: FAD-dependent oxidoreductase, partial [Halobacteriaceae archaeon]